MLLALNIFQALGFYGFTNWVPALLLSQGVSFVKSLQYSFVIAIVYPLTPLLCIFIADRIERKWQIVIGATGTAVFGLLFSQQSAPATLILCGALVTVSNIVLSYAYHTYQTELCRGFPGTTNGGTNTRRGVPLRPANARMELEKS